MQMTHVCLCFQKVDNTRGFVFLRDTGRMLDACQMCESCCCCVCVNEVSNALLTKKKIRQCSTTATYPPSADHSKSESAFVACSCHHVCQRKQTVFMKERTYVHGCLPHTDSCSITDEGLVSFTRVAWMHHAIC